MTRRYLRRYLQICRYLQISADICSSTISRHASRYLRLINLKRHIDYFSKGPKSSRTDHAQKRRSFRVNSILSFCHNDKHETQHVGQLISIKGHTIFNSVPFYAYQPDCRGNQWPMGSRVTESVYLVVRRTKSLLLGVKISLLIKINANKTHPPAYALPSPS
jgi:hypothetical protein